MKADDKKLRAFLIWLAIVVAIGLVLFFRYYLGALAADVRIDFLVPFISEMTGSLGAGLLFPVLWLARRFPLDRRRVPLYFLAMLAFFDPPPGRRTCGRHSSGRLLLLAGPAGLGDRGAEPGAADSARGPESRGR